MSPTCPHELRTPLANIDLAAQTLRQSAASDPAMTRRMLDQIQVQVQTLSQLSLEMLELAQIESGQVLLKLEPREVEPVVRRSITHLLPQAAQKNQHVSVVVQRGSARRTARDQDRHRQARSNWAAGWSSPR